MSVGELIAFNLLAGRVSAPVLRLAQTWQDFHQARLSVERLGDILNTAPEPVYNPGKMALAAVRGDISFENVSFRYRIDGPEILHDINLEVPAGQVLGIVGTSGSGKSTLAKLVQRLYLPESGRVLIDGVDIAQVDPARLRRQIGVVLQDSTLFNCSVRDNIALVDPAIPAENIMPPPSSQEPTISSSSFPRAMTPSSASVVAPCLADNVNASLLLARSSQIPAYSFSTRRRVRSIMKARVSCKRIWRRWRAGGP